MGNYSSLELLLATYAFAFQIFFDFSAYSDIAIGTARVFGLELLVNFRFPYISSNPREFWQRWDINLWARTMGPATNWGKAVINKKNLIGSRQGSICFR